jgi:hypothetical protein
LILRGDLQIPHRVPVPQKYPQLGANNGNDRVANDENTDERQQKAVAGSNAEDSSTGGSQDENGELEEWDGQEEQMGSRKRTHLPDNTVASGVTTRSGSSKRTKTADDRPQEPATDHTETPAESEEEMVKPPESNTVHTETPAESEEEMVKPQESNTDHKETPAESEEEMVKPQESNTDHTETPAESEEEMVKLFSIYLEEATTNFRFLCRHPKAIATRVLSALNSLLKTQLLQIAKENQDLRSAIDTKYQITMEHIKPKKK